MTQAVSVVPGGHAVRVEEYRTPRSVSERRGARTPLGTSWRSWASTSGSGKAEKGALLRREGLYTSLISAWREQRDKGALAAMQATSRGPKAVNPAAREKERLEARTPGWRPSWARPGR